MKKILFGVGMVLIVSAINVACSHKAALAVGKSADVAADFKDIKTYNWASDIDNIPNTQLFIGANGVLIFNNESARKMIKDAIEYELDSRGYKKVEGNAGDMKVSFAILEQPGKVRTTNGYVTLSSGENVLTKDNVSYTDVKAGTLIINFISNKNNVAIWQGFASGILQPDQMRDQTKIREAVAKIFTQYKYSNVK
jgi:hypothetical protein